jgi:hypothetical protein
MNELVPKRRKETKVECTVVMSSYDNRRRVLKVLEQLAQPKYARVKLEVILIDAHADVDDELHQAVASFRALALGSR